VQQKFVHFNLFSYSFTFETEHSNEVNYRKTSASIWLFIFVPFLTLNL